MNLIIAVITGVFFVVLPVMAEPFNTHLNARVDTAFRAVQEYNQAQGIVLPRDNVRCRVDERAVVFVSDIPVEGKSKAAVFSEHSDNIFSVTTIFQRQSSTIEKRIHIQDGAGDLARMRFSLIHEDGAGRELVQYVFNDGDRTWQVYESPTDVYFYTQVQTRPDQIEIKEWIYAEKPNAGTGSVYRWRMASEEPNRFFEFKPFAGGGLALQRYPVVGNVKPGDHEEDKRIVEVVRRAMGNRPVKIYGLDTIALLSPVSYVTQEKIFKKGLMQVDRKTELTVSVSENVWSYPLVIDPSITFSDHQE